MSAQQPPAISIQRPGILIELSQSGPFSFEDSRAAFSKPKDYLAIKSPASRPIKGAKLCTFHCLLSPQGRLHFALYHDLLLDRQHCFSSRPVCMHHLLNRAGLPGLTFPLICGDAHFAMLALLVTSVITIMPNPRRVELNMLFGFTMVPAQCAALCDTKTKKVLQIA